MKCGSHDTITRESRMFHWRPTWARYLVMCGIGLFVMLVTTQSASLEIPLCPKCTERWSTARTAQIAAVLGIAIGFAVLNSLPRFPVPATSTTPSATTGGASAATGRVARRTRPGQ